MTSDPQSMTHKYGFVALLDALGTRTASLDEAAKYLDLIREIEKDITLSLKVTLERGGEADATIFDKLSIRFFGDTLLITYEIQDREKEKEYFYRIGFVLRMFLCRAFELGLIFRGSLAIGDYVDKGSVVLGPAVTDAANWYEKLDMMGVILTPYATLAMKHIYLEKSLGPLVWVWSGEAVLEKPPLKHFEGSGSELFHLNWVNGIVPVGEFSEEEEIEWFYRTIRQFRIPLGTESKLANTEAFFLRHYKEVAEARKAEQANAATQTSPK